MDFLISSEIIDLKYVKLSDLIIYTDEEIDAMKNERGIDYEFVTASPDNAESISICVEKDVDNIITLDVYSEMTISNLEKWDAC